MKNLTELALKAKLRNMIWDRQEREMESDIELSFYSRELNLELVQAFMENNISDELIKLKYGF